MMTELSTILTISAASLLGLTIASYAVLTGWRNWLDVRRLEIERRREDDMETRAPSTGSRIEVADLKERVRKLEAIAAGIEI